MRVYEDVDGVGSVLALSRRLRGFDSRHPYAGLAQLVEQEFSKLQVAGSSPASRSNFKATPCLSYQIKWRDSGTIPAPSRVSQAGKVTVCKTVMREFEPHTRLQKFRVC